MIARMSRRVRCYHDESSRVHAASLGLRNTAPGTVAALTAIVVTGFQLTSESDG